MCNACGWPARPGHWADAGLATQSDRVRARFRRTDLMALFLAPYHLTARDDGSAGGIALFTQSGRHVLARTIEDLWDKAAGLADRPVDPLDPALFTRDG